MGNRESREGEGGIGGLRGWCRGEVGDEKWPFVLAIAGKCEQVLFAMLCDVLGSAFSESPAQRLRIGDRKRY